ncbi:hypothetical protein N665_0491s0005, partial [Sinapis alba]
RISRVWHIIKHQTNQIPTGFICFDHQGQLFVGKLPTNILPQNKYSLTEGDIYEILQFMVLPNFRKQKFTTHPYLIQFTQQTTMKKIENINPSFPVHRFSFQKYNHLLRLATVNSYLPGNSFSSPNKQQ